MYKAGYKLLCLTAAMLAIAGCKDGHLAGDDPTRNDEGVGEGRPMDSNQSVRERSPETPLEKQRVYADDEATEQSTAAPPDPE